MADQVENPVDPPKSEEPLTEAQKEEEAAKCAEIKTLVEMKMKSVQADMDCALPLIEKAMNALKSITIQDYKDLSALQSPQEDVQKTFTSLLHLLCKHNPEVPVDEKGKLKTDDPWKTALTLMVDPQKFVDSLFEFKQAIEDDKIPHQNFAAIRPILADETFTTEIVTKASPAAAALCDWVINMTMYCDVNVSVEPKKLAVKEAQETLAAAVAKGQLNPEDYKVDDSKYQYCKVDPINLVDIEKSIYEF